ncbi:heat shock protein DnaJ domain-containing protein [Sphaerospermopsis reniformis]|uniref:Heat shock protein DnaJ domain-containing protein n=1 Tax=Sphaerospermopsis reniformis TaxID=531300 RepID=A0A480A3F1_9CYAN|nr:IMS domain-containing protein [Sphaerospermopsis reniformis]GCL39022.1 heat shock protein DnaJ domain-containing protein [Sphaerospermopsis reniformis]
MRIPLDYYRILGLPLAASEEQLRQAYSDRIVQLPRREYSIAAISSRKQLIEEAYVVLSNPRERSTYDQAYLAQAYNPDRLGATSLLENSTETINRNHDVQSLSIEIAPDELVGALLLLQELGEYELVLKLGRPHLVNRNKPAGVKIGSHLNSEEFFASPELPDIILTVALACLELGREQWQQGNYENAAISLETGEELLMREGLFPNVQAEIAADLCKLRPYRILELLELPLEKTKERRQGLELLHSILEERGGIDGSGNDQSGLNIDDFLRFIQQLRNHLTVAEQHKLFEAESKRPSAVSTYLAVYALIARGFAQRQPALIRQAKQMLIRLGKRQDVHLEQSLCALLLGQTEEATRVLELSQEYEALAIIREKSQDSPDLLPGLCLYCEHWLQQEVFPHFRDLVKKQASLKEYFADKQVQAYLEALPKDTQATDEWTTINKQFFTSPTINSTRYHSYHNVSNGINHGVSNGTVNHNYTPDPEFYTSAPSEVPESANYSPPEWHSRRYSNSHTPEMPEPSATAEEAGTEYYQQINAGNYDVTSQTKKRRRCKPVAVNSRSLVSEHQHSHARRRRTFANSLDAKTRLVWLVFLSMGGLLVFWLLVSTVWGWFNNVFFPEPTVQGTPLAIELNQPPVTIPEPNSSKPEVPEGQLTPAIAQDVIEKWLSTKAAVFGPDHQINRLNEILTVSAIPQWQSIVKQDIAEKRYRKYEHDVKVEFVNQTSNMSDNAVVEATVREVTHFYQRNQFQQTSQDRLRVRYDLIRKQGSWRIQGMTVVKTLNS